MTTGTDEEVARLTYELERVEEGRRRLRAALAEQRAAADAYAARAEAEAIAAAGGSTGDVVAAHGDLCQSLRSRLDATSAEEDARAHDLRATCAALQLSAALASTEYRSPTPALTLTLTLTLTLALAQTLAQALTLTAALAGAWRYPRPGIRPRPPAMRACWAAGPRGWESRRRPR